MIEQSTLDEWRDWTNDATPGEWDCTTINGFWGSATLIIGEECVAGREDCKALSYDDAAFIVLARTAMPKLLDEIAELRAKLARLEKTDNVKTS